MTARRAPRTVRASAGIALACSAVCRTAAAFSGCAVVLFCCSFGRPFAVKHSGNITLDQIIDIARIMRPRSMAKTLSGTVKEILGTAYRFVIETSAML